MLRITATFGGGQAAREAANELAGVERCIQELEIDERMAGTRADNGAAYDGN